MKEIVFAGFGGQGVLLAGQMLAQIAVDSGQQATCMPSYGVSMRGGTANCVVHISEGDIYSPGMEETDYLIALNPPAFEKFKSGVVSGGVIFFNSDSGDIDKTVPKGVKLVQIPAVSLASSVADARSANAVVLGVMLRMSGIFNLDTACKTIQEYFEESGKDKVGKLFSAAFKLGYKWPERE